MTPEGWMVAYQSQAQLVFALAATHPDRPVPSCPGWTMQDLAAHVGAAPTLWGPVVEAPPGAAPGEVMAPDIPEDLEEMLAWCELELRSMVELFRTCDPAEPAWTGAANGTIGFWMRRAALETAVHLWDAANAVGEDHEIGAELVADGLDELVELFPVLADWSDQHPAATLRVAPSDLERTWTFAGSSEAAAIPVIGSAGDVYLTLWGRRTVAAESAPAVEEWVTLVQTMAA